MKWTTKWLSFICSQSCVYVINATVTVAGRHGVAPSRPKRRKPTNDKLMTQQTTLQKIRFENGLAVAKSKIEYVMCRIEEIRLQLQGSPSRRSHNAVSGRILLSFLPMGMSDKPLRDVTADELKYAKICACVSVSADSQTISADSSACRWCGC